MHPALSTFPALSARPAPSRPPPQVSVFLTRRGARPRRVQMSSRPTRSGRVRKPRSPHRAHPNRRSVLKMMAVMQREDHTLPNEFLVTGRTGRRNAMPDILDPPHAGMTTAGLPERLQQLATSDPDEAQAGTSTTDPNMKVEQPKDCSQQSGTNS